MLRILGALTLTVLTLIAVALLFLLGALSDLRLSDDRLADVRIFQFEETQYSIPVDWMRLDAPSYGAIGGVDRLALGRFDPDLHTVECPGVVHQITNGGLHLPRYAGIGFAPFSVRAEAVQIGIMKNVSFFYAHKIRRSGDNIREVGIPELGRDGLVESMDHRTLDAFIRVAPDVGIRIGWHPADITAEAWARQFDERSAGPLVRQMPKPWTAVPKTAEFAQLAATIRQLHTW